MYKITQAMTIGLFTLAISMFAAAGHHGMKKDWQAPSFLET